ncbi:MAG TPA: MFS transporter [Thermoleophilaceae bacterium]|jgi:DHA2 family methylenomycin A resistance protein-like MFS transporter
MRTVPADRGEAARHLAGLATTRRGLAAVALAGALVPLNSTLIALGLPDVADDLDASVGAASWLVTAYLIATVSVQSVAGKLGDRLGRERSVRLGIAAFAVASAAAAAAPGLPLLVAARVLQGAFGALMFASALALLRELPGAERARALGLVAATLSIAPAVALPLGGALVAAGGWRVLFLLNVPLAAGALALGRGAWARRAAAAPPAPFDLAGAMLLCALLAGVAALLQLGGGLPTPAAAAAYAALAAGAWAWLRLERRAPDPVLPPRFFARPAFSGAIAGMALANLSMYAALLVVPLLAAAGTAGLLLGAFTAAAALASWAGGRILAERRRRLPAAAGLALLAAALAPLALAGDDPATALLLPCLALAGTGLGVANPALFGAGMEALDARDAGVATSVLLTSRYLGAIVAAALLAALVDAAGSGSATMFLLASGAAAAAAILAAALMEGRSWRDRGITLAVGIGRKGER